MTGQGHAQIQNELGTFSVEVRTVNNRGLKCVIRTSDSLSSLESKIEATARTLIHRGSVQLNLQWRRPGDETPQRINETVLAGYFQQCRRVLDKQNGNGSIDITGLLELPGVLINSPVEDRQNDDVIWDAVHQTLVAAIVNLNQLRDAEGVNMAASLEADCQVIRTQVDEITLLAPEAIESYRERLETKVKQALEKHDINVQTVDLLREVQVYADRADISEEVTRLGSHLQLFLAVMRGEHTDRKTSPGDKSTAEPTGRKLDFIIQEMFRETNTIGSKANHAGISARVVEVKCAIERMRELVQNLE
ncbi:Conserved hypothetical protein CHP00255 [Stieleria varia]|uniref:YicC family protein n=2 Tax=Stieleria varia TaxID=2528005 RepID=A0A5C6B830_9BACT|nr:Conserved hypothetical protein CHP00255 [Stieleria varia]